MATGCLLVPIADDPHTQGLFRVARMARRAGIPTHVLPPGSTDEDVFARLHALDSAFLGLSYRLSPEVGAREIERLLVQLDRRGLLHCRDTGRPRKVAAAGLPETMHALEDRQSALPCRVVTVPQDTDGVRGAARLLRFFGVDDRRAGPLLAELRVELSPPRIALLDELAQEITATDAYREEPPLPVPSDAARASYVRRMQESPFPLLRTHFGIPDERIEPTVEGIEQLAEAQVIDEVSLGSSDLSQRHFGHPEAFTGRKNDGGVPYRTVEDLERLANATRRGNYPAIKPYAHVVDLVPFIDTCLRAGMLLGGHQAVPLYWFNELDGRGPMTVRESIHEHIAAVRELAARGIPVEMNDPNQWSSRWAHDTIISADYALITAVMLHAGVQDLVLQLQVNKPRETGDYADLAKMTAGLELAAELLPAAASEGPPRIHRETRAGIDAFDPNLDVARYQLARSTLLQLLLEPQVIHLVSYCEALHAATAEDIIDSSRLVRRCVRVYRRHAPDLRRFLEDDAVVTRRRHLTGEATLLLRRIAALCGPTASPEAPLRELVDRLANPAALAAALDHGLMAAPGIFHPGYASARGGVTGPTAGGGIDCLSPETGLPMSEGERLDRLERAAEGDPC
ncbi:MAG: hypothetical protein ABI333_06245 [bacterium]